MLKKAALQRYSIFNILTLSVLSIFIWLSSSFSVEAQVCEFPGGGASKTCVCKADAFCPVDGSVQISPCCDNTGKYTGQETCGWRSGCSCDVISFCSGGGAPKVPNGAHDSWFTTTNNASECRVAGWTCDGDNFSRQLNVKIYEGSSLINTVTANQNSPDLGPTACNGTPNHRFSYQLPVKYMDGKPHNFKAIVDGIRPDGSVDSSSTLPKWWAGSFRPADYTLTCNVCNSLLVQGRVLSRYTADGSLGAPRVSIAGVTVEVKNDSSGEVALVNTDASGNYAAVIRLCGSDTYSVSVPKQAIPDYYEIALTDPERYRNYPYQDMVGGCAVKSSGKCDFMMYPLPKSACRINDKVTVNPGIFPFTADFRNDAYNGRESIYSFTLDYGDGSGVKTITPPPPISNSIDSHTYDKAMHYVIPLTANLSFTSAEGTRYSASPSVSHCTIGVGIPYKVSGFVNSEAGGGIEGIGVEVNGEIVYTDNTGEFTTYVNQGIPYEIKIVGNASSNLCGNDPAVNLIELKNGKYHMKPLLNPANQMEYLDQIPGNGDCGQTCNFTYYLSPYADYTLAKADPLDTAYPYLINFSNFITSNILYSSDTDKTRLECHHLMPDGEIATFDNPTGIKQCQYDRSGISIFSNTINRGLYSMTYCANRTIAPDNEYKAWWQVEEGNVFSNFGGGTDALKSQVPTGSNLFSFGGTATAWSGGIKYGSGGLGSAVAIGQTGQYGGETYNYQYWSDKLSDYTYFIPGVKVINQTFLNSSLVSGVYQLDNDTDILELKSLDFGSKQLAILFDGDISLQGNITSTAKDGVFILIVSGKITVQDASLDELHGFYIADKAIATGKGEGSKGFNKKLTIRGGLISWQKVLLQSEYADSSDPAEKFFQNKDMVNALKFSEPLRAFRVYQYTWREIEP